MKQRIILLIFISILITGCGYGQFQTAKTLKRGSFKITATESIQQNSERPLSDAEGPLILYHFPANIDFRAGLSDRVDMGVKLFMLSGLLVDTKVNFMNPKSKFALSVTGGFGYAYSFSDDSHVLNMPIGIISSYTFADKFTPYLGVTYNIFWFVGKEAEGEPEAGFEYTTQKGYGDHVIRISAGAEWIMLKHFGLIAEYSIWLPTVNDPGDNFKVLVNHFAGLGIVIPF